MKRCSPPSVGIELCTLLAALAVSACSEHVHDTGTEVTGVLSVSYNPSPVPWGAGPGSTTICANSANVWRFNAVFTESGGSAISITTMVNSLDGTAQAPIASTISVPARGSFTIAREFCFPASTQHTVASSFSGTDAGGHAFTLTGPTVTLLAR